MDTLIYWPARALVALIQALPLTLVARLAGRLADWPSGSTRGTGAWR